MAQYFDNVDLKSEIKTINVEILGLNLKFNTDNGIFSKDKLDFGTRVLLENIDISSISGKVLDMGCGYGPIGIIISRLTNSSVDMCDINKRALHLALMNLKLNNVNANVFESDSYSNIKDKYDYIVTNPPIRVGKKILYSILMGASEHLLPSGKMYLVIHKDQGAKSLINDLEKSYNVSVIEKKNGFFVILCTFR